MSDTFDVDLLVCHDDRSAWLEALQSLGYQLANQAPAFAQFSAPPEGEAVDLMWVKISPFEGMWAAAKTIELDGRLFRIPSLPVWSMLRTPP